MGYELVGNELIKVRIDLYPLVYHIKNWGRVGKNGVRVGRERVGKNRERVGKNEVRVGRERVGKGTS